MEQMEWVTFSLIQDGLARSRKESEDELIHEQQFVSTRLKGVNQIGVCCLTCGDCYCELW